MSEGEIGRSIGELIRSVIDPPQPPGPLRETERATWGAFLLGICAYGWLTLGPYLPGPWKLGLAALTAFGLLLLVVGLRGSNGQPRSVMGVFWNLALLIGGGWAVAHWFPGLWQNFFGRGFCIGMICGSAVRLYIALRGFPAAPWETQDPGMPHGTAGFANPDDPRLKL